MSDELRDDDPLRRMTEALHAPVAVRPGLMARSRARARTAQRRRVGVSLAGAAALAVVLVWRTPRGDGLEAVTFALRAPPSTPITLVGDFNDWQTGGVPMHRTADGGAAATVRLRPGRYRFAYVTAGGEWIPDERAAPVTDDFGRPTSVVTVVAP